MLKKLRKYEDITDRIEEEMAIYLTKIGQGSLTEDTSTKIRALHKMIANLERIGDIYYGMSISLENKKESKVWFTQGQRDNLNKYLDLLDKTFNQLKSNLESEFGQVNLDKAIELEHDNNKLQESLHQQHIIDLEKGEYDFKSAMHYRDLFMACEKVGDHLINVSESMQMKI
jgi:phosphate:Na+ symporter